MSDHDAEIAQPLEAKVNPHKWTTKVNIAVVLAVIVVLFVGAGVTIYAILKPREVQQEIHEDVDSSVPPG